MNSWGWVALSCAGFIGSCFLFRAVGRRLIAVELDREDEEAQQEYEDLKRALGDER